MASTTAAGSAYATHGEHMIPFYIFYSMFGFQRTGDSIWAMADQLARGFLVGATAGRTTLTGEGLQHADGHSPAAGGDQPGGRALRPGDGLRGQPHRAGRPAPDVRLDRRAPGRRERHLLPDGLQRADPSSRRSPRTSTSRACSAGSTTSPTPPTPPRTTPRGCSCSPPASASRGSPRRRELLAEDWGVAAETWSVTSWNELARDGVATEEWNLLHPDEDARTPYVTSKLQEAQGPFVAVSDYMRAVQNQIAKWVPGDYHALGTDGFGFADTRPAARRYFHVDAESVAVQALAALADRGEVKPEVVTEAFDEVPHRRPHRRRRAQAGGRRRLSLALASAVRRGGRRGRPCRPGGMPRRSRGPGDAARRRPLGQGARPGP